ncbi:MAG TPA: hypothetical protein VK510_03150 [Solirubrobacteraceae bacterium]|nr:hypothetical protein [Solirubrobacteraceae bacterium]
MSDALKVGLGVAAGVSLLLLWKYRRGLAGLASGAIEGRDLEVAGKLGITDELLTGGVAIVQQNDAMVEAFVDDTEKNKAKAKAFYDSLIKAGHTAEAAQFKGSGALESGRIWIHEWHPDGTAILNVGNGSYVNAESGKEWAEKAGIPYVVDRRTNTAPPPLRTETEVRQLPDGTTVVLPAQIPSTTPPRGATSSGDGTTPGTTPKPVGTPPTTTKPKSTPPKTNPKKTETPPRKYSRRDLELESFP